MTVIIRALEKLGFGNEAAEVSARWKELLDHIEPMPPPEFQRCYPDSLLTLCTDEAIEATREIGCSLATDNMPGTVRGKLNEAWTTLWRNPPAYQAWEKGAVEELHARFGARA
jgi:hypothetical protein